MRRQTEKHIKTCIWATHPELNFLNSLPRARESGAVAKLIQKAAVAVESDYRRFGDDGGGGGDHHAPAAASAASAGLPPGGAGFGFSRRVAFIVGKELDRARATKAAAAARRAKENAEHAAMTTLVPGDPVWVKWDGPRDHRAIFVGCYESKLHVEFIDDQDQAGANVVGTLPVRAAALSALCTPPPPRLQPCCTNTH